MKRLAISVTIMLCLALAVQAKAAGSTAKTKIRTFKLKGTLSSASTTGACTGVDSTYYDFCPSGNCLCYVSNPTAPLTVTGSQAGKGTASLEATADIGAITTPQSPTPQQGCTPVFVVITADTVLKGASITEELNVVGAVCHHTAKNKMDSFNGGAGIFSATNSATGWGSGSGTLDANTGVVSLTFKLDTTQ